MQFLQRNSQWTKSELASDGNLDQKRDQIQVHFSESRMCTGKFIREFWPRAHAHWGKLHTQQQEQKKSSCWLYCLVEFLHSSAPPRECFICAPRSLFIYKKPPGQRSRQCRRRRRWCPFLRILNCCTRNVIIGVLQRGGECRRPCCASECRAAWIFSFTT